jgi:hypothetical protein
VVRPARPSATILYKIPLLTYHAYNLIDGQAYDPHTESRVRVRDSEGSDPFERYPLGSPAHQCERHPWTAISWAGCRSESRS